MKNYGFKYPNGHRSAIAVAGRFSSRYDGKRIRVIVNCLRDRSKDRKLGAMAQVLICPDDVLPHDAVKTGADFSVCGDCEFRPANGGGCYCNLGAYFPRVWEVSAKLPDDLDAACSSIRESGLPLRIGSWGDPSAVPQDVIRRLVDAARGPNGEPRHTMYVHDRTRCPEFRDIGMSSETSEAGQREAVEEGWRTLRVRLPEMPVLPGEIVCPASKEAGHKTTCSDCLLCSGSGRKGPNVVVQAHGSRGKIQAVLRLLNRKRK